MKILIVSDSHGLETELFDVLDRHEPEVDLILHCGDSELPFTAFSPYQAKLHIVGGNCDLDANYHLDISETVEDLTIFLTHGHLYNVKSSLLKLTYRAKETGARLVCFGHSHVAGSVFEDGVLFVNPGSLRLPRNRSEKSYSIVTFKNNKFDVNFYDHKGQEIEALKNVYQIV